MLGEGKPASHPLLDHRRSRSRELSRHEDCHKEVRPTVSPIFSCCFFKFQFVEVLAEVCVKAARIFAAELGSPSVSRIQLVRTHFQGGGQHEDDEDGDEDSSAADDDVAGENG